MFFGKIPVRDFLNKIKTGNCEICPEIGEDDAIIRSEGNYLVIHSDPITEAGKDAGFLSVAVACNDVNMKGVPCKWVLTTVLLTKRENLDVIIDGINEACNFIGCSVVGGHTEVTRGLQQDIVVTTAFSFSDKIMKLSDGKVGDYIGVFGFAGTEGTWILANEFENELVKRGVKHEILEKAKKLKYFIPVQEKALKVKDDVIAMHDATEGGIYQALLEVAKSTKKKVLIFRDPPILQETLEITKVLNINPYTLISSGAFIVITRNPQKIEEFGGVIIGKIVEGEDVLEVKGDKVYKEDFEEELVKFESNYYGWRKRD
ncbi:AIR synthase family protein [Sulfurisphaera ohwakuensis]|uniref:AIR synthase n=1 Tax=Sulfurisphaera ohwakuensis TaxID=69656 RepID=A0A650CEJ2_SULOH|nr:AIR synthase family protein [Sulfurisphaera ohwakuensis]MBB5252798.1 hydrogenase maturation factor [Sulfurisphaera ohwakuensis]QGR16261.1 AIR synthase [Sulfurisphaera ohwakuensis]